MAAKDYNAKRLFWMSCIALVVTSMTFAIRARLEPLWESEFQLSATQYALAIGTAFWGFTLAQFIGGPFVDLLGMKKFIRIAFVLHICGIGITLFAQGFWTLFFGTLCIGIGNGSVEACCNPLVTAMFPKDKTKMLNRFHTWFPGGMVIGSLIAYLIIDMLHLPWQLLVGILIIPLVIYGLLMFGQKFPATERVEMGVSYKSMWNAVISPLFLIMLFCMLLSSATELSTGQRISSLLADTGVAPILVLAFIQGIMALGRGFVAGPIVKILKTKGMLYMSAIVSTIGLLLMSTVQGEFLTFAAAAVFAVGVCFFWPTMLGFLSENIPESGALGLSIFGGAGMLANSIFLPISGSWTDAGLSGQEILRNTAVFPAILVVLFTIIFSVMKRRKNKAAQINK